MTNRQQLLNEYWKFLDLCEDHYTTSYRKPHASPPAFPKPRKISPRETQLVELYAQMEDCQKCLYRYNRGHGKMAQGPLSPKLCVVSMSPEADIDQEDSVFSKEAEEYLTKWLSAIKINIHESYRTNIIKCRPPQKESNHWTESSVCLDYFKKQIQLVEPGIILSLGQMPAQLLANEKEKTLSELEGGIYAFEGIPLFCTHHPHDVLEQPNLRSAVWEDLKHLREFMDQNEL